MSERYSKLFALSENLYASGSPVVIAAGALLKDNQTGKVIAQLKLRNISKNAIKAAKVCISPFDTVGNPIGDSVSYQYLDLNAKRNEDFGQKAAIALPDSATRSFAAVVEEILFADNTIWKATGKPWDVMGEPKPLREIGDAELVKQFRMEYGGNCKNLLLEEKDLWHCACGALNRKEESACHQCGKSLSVLQSIDMDALKQKRDIRVAAEREQAEKDAAAAQAQAKKTAKIAAIVVPILAVIIVAAVLISNMVKNNNAYKDAVALMDAGQYEEAIEAFTALDGYKDSAEQIQLAENTIAELERAAELEATYNNAIRLLESDVSENENEAYHILMELGDYKDAKELLADFQYAIITETAESNIENNGDYTRFYEYDDRGLLIAKSYDGGATLSYAYDDNGRLVKEVGSQSWLTTEYTYYEDSTRKSVKAALAKYDSGGIDYITSSFDNSGNPITIKTLSGQSGKGTTWSFTCTLADNGSLLALECIYTNANNEVVDTEVYDFSNHEGFVSFDFALSPSRIIVICADWDGKQETIYKIEYVSYQKEIKISEYENREYDNNGNVVKVNETYFENAYDETGNLTQVTRKHTNGTEVKYSYIYGYIYTPDAA